MKKSLCWILVLLALAMTLSGCASPSAPAATQKPTATPVTADQQRYSIMYLDTFDTIIQLIGFTENKETFDRVAESAHKSFQHLHKLFDAYNDYTDEGIVSVYTLNQRAALEPVEVDPVLMDLLVFCRERQPTLHNTVNVAMGSVLSIWHDYREAGLDDPAQAQLPPMDALRDAAQHVSMDDVVLDEEKCTVFFRDPAVKLDVGSVAKGYAAEFVARQLTASAMPSFIISAGGNVRVGAPPKDGRSAWGIGVQKPEGYALSTSQDDLLETFYVADMSVVTSGDYQRYYIVDGKRYHHLIDPGTLMPGEFYRAVTILTADSGLADMLSTTAFLLPYEESRALIDSLEGVEALWVMPDESIVMTDGAKALAKSQGAKAL